MGTTSLKIHQPPPPTVPLATLHDRPFCFAGSQFLTTPSPASLYPPIQFLSVSPQPLSGQVPFCCYFYVGQIQSPPVTLPDDHWTLCRFTKNVISGIPLHRSHLVIFPSWLFVAQRPPRMTLFSNDTGFSPVCLVKVRAIHRYVNIGLIIDVQRQTPVHLENSFNLRY